MNGKLRYLFLIMILFFSLGSYSQASKEAVSYKVKKKDTIFSIAKKNGLTVVELMDANPVMKQEGYELKKVIRYSFLSKVRRLMSRLGLRQVKKPVVRSLP